MKSAALWAFSCLFSILLAGCNMSTDQPLFSATDAAEVKLKSGYYRALGSDVAYIKVFEGKTVVTTQTDNRRPYDALTIALGDDLYLLQYGNIDEAARDYVLFRYEPEGSGISTAVYDCKKDANFFKGFGISMTEMPNGFCRMTGVTKEQMVRAQRAIAKALPGDAWRKYYSAIRHDEGINGFRQQDKFPARSRP